MCNTLYIYVAYNTELSEYAKELRVVASSCNLFHVIQKAPLICRHVATGHSGPGRNQSAPKLSLGDFFFSIFFLPS